MGVVASFVAQLIGIPAFWLALLLGLGACLLPDVALQGIRRRFFPHDFHIIQVGLLPSYQKGRSTEISGIWHP
jgi:hypothetical protein